MTAQLPTPGGDDGTWGTILNGFLLAAHNSDGTLQTSAVQQAGGITSVNGKSTTSGSVSIATTDLTDTEIASPSGNQVLAYNGSTSKWTNATLTESDVTNLSSDLSTLTSAVAAKVSIGGDLSGSATSPTVTKVNGISVSGGSPSSGQVLTATTGSTAAWSTPTTGSGSSTLAGETDVSITTPTSNQILAYNSSAGKWENQSPGSGVSLDTTATDIQPDTVSGSAIAGNTNKAADAGHRHPLVSHAHTSSTTGGQLSVGALSASGTASSSTYLRGDGSWNTPSGGAPSGSAGGDLTGTYPNPTLSASTNVESIISSNTTVTGALQKGNNLSDVSDAGSSRANLHIPYLTLAAACGNDTGGMYTAPSGNTGATFSPFSGYVDGYYAATGDMILLVNESVNGQTGSNATAAANGLWQVQIAGANGTWIRPTEFASGMNVDGRAITVMNGAVNSGPWYLQAPSGGLVIDTNSQTWVSGGNVWTRSFSLLEPSGDATGGTDVANINTVLAAGGNLCLVPGATYFINSPITPISQSFITGFQWNGASQDDNYGTGAGNPVGAVIQAVNFTGAAMILMQNDTYDQYYGVDISGLSLISYSGAMPTTSHGIGAYGYWGACFIRGVQIQKVGCDCLHIDTSTVSNGICDDWQVTDCKFSGARNGCGVNIVNDLPDSWFDNCESSENALDGWSINWCDNTRWSNCKGENNGSAGWHFTGNGADHLAQFSNCTAQINNQDGWLFDPDTDGEYLLIGCRSHGDNVSASTYAGFRSNGSQARIIGTGCYSTGAAYGAYEASSSYGMHFTGSYLTGTTADLYDDGSNTHPLANVVPSFSNSTGTGIAAGVITLTAGSTISVNAAQGNDFRLSPSASGQTIANPTSSIDGQVVRFQITQPASGGPYTVSWGSNYSFGASGIPTLSTPASKVDIIGFVYNVSISKWCYLGAALGY
jgi:hypothetical protein